MKTHYEKLSLPRHKFTKKQINQVCFKKGLTIIVAVCSNKKPVLVIIIIVAELKNDVH